ncbi:MAG: damage-inducible protein DinB [Spirochaetaceae bacterium]|nr:damage-inducible protein DinB [Spirochaetaceae bacterium]
MKAWFVTFAEYMREADSCVYTILDGLSNEDREKERGSFYGSLSGLVLHLLGGTLFFHSLFKGALKEGSAAAKALDYPAPIGKESFPKGPLTEAQWKSLGPCFEAADRGTIDFARALTDEELNTPIKLDWYEGNPPSVPLFFMLQQLIAHGIHHRGQISQILDELKVDNDYSGINVAFLPK